MPIARFLLRCTRSNCCHANNRCLWHLVYINCSPDAEAELLRHLRKGHIHSTSASVGLLPSSTAVRSPDGLDRPPADREQPHRHPQRRPPIFWAFDANFAASGVKGPRIAGELSVLSTNGPRVSGAIFIGTGWLPRLQASATNWPGRQRHTKTICNVAYHIQEYIQRSYQQSRAYQGDGHVQSARDSERDLAEDGQRMHASAFSCASQIHNWPKGADAAPVGPSYNSSLQRPR